MFSSDIIYQCIFLFLYFDSDFSRVDCYLLSRAKNPIVLFGETPANTSDENALQLSNPALGNETVREEPVALSNIINGFEYVEPNPRNIYNNVSEYEEIVLTPASLKLHKSGFIKPYKSLNDIYGDNGPELLNPEFLNNKQVNSDDTSEEPSDKFPNNLDMLQITRLEDYFVNPDKPVKTPWKDMYRYEQVATYPLSKNFYTKSGTSSTLKISENYWIIPIEMSTFPERDHDRNQIPLSEFSWRKNLVPTHQENYSVFQDYKQRKTSPQSVGQQLYPQASSVIAEFYRDEALRVFKEKNKLLNKITSTTNKYIFHSIKSSTPYNYLVGTLRNPVIQNRPTIWNKFYKFTPFLTPKRNRYQIMATIDSSRLKKIELPEEQSTRHFKSNNSSEYTRQQLKLNDEKIAYRLIPVTTPRIPQDYWNQYNQIEYPKISETINSYKSEPVQTTNAIKNYWKVFWQQQNDRNLELIDERKAAKTREYPSVRTTSDAKYVTVFDTETLFNDRPTIRESLLNLFGPPPERDKGTTVANRSDQRQGFKTLWTPTPSEFTSSKITEAYEDSHITSTKFAWDFNARDAAWPQMELIFPTTQKIVTSTRLTKTFPTYFPFYWRREDEQSTAKNKEKSVAYLNFILNSTSTTETYRRENGLVKDQSGTNKCYVCGLDGEELPNFPTCHDIFECSNNEMSYKMIKYRKKCPNSGGCFKRFVDVGDIYNERGCRSNPPQVGKSYASQRLAKLEKALHGVKEGCFTSPEASLTPFSRAISLYVRYHVCVCNTRYCNGAFRMSVNVVLITFIILISLYN